MNFKKKFFIYLFLIFFNFNFAQGLENKILIKINNDIITTIDLYNEKNYLIALNREINNLEQNEIFEIAKNSIIKEKIKTYEILRYTDKLILDDNLLNQIIESTYKKKNFKTYEKYIDYLKDYDVSIEYLKKKISIEFIWNDLIKAKFSNKIKIDMNNIRSELKKELSKTSTEYFLSEIIFKNVQNLNFNEKYKIIESDIKNNGFKNAVLIHSISSSSSENSGEIGWVNENSLNNEIKNLLKKLKKGDHSRPIIVPGGFLILKIDDIKTVENKDYDLEKEIEKIILSKKNEQLNNFSNIYFNKIQKEYIINEQL